MVTPDKNTATTQTNNTTATNQPQTTILAVTWHSVLISQEAVIKILHHLQQK